MNLNHIHKIYFIGIGGIGMSALARYFMDMGKEVSGYDKTPSPITKELENSSIFIHFDDKLDLIPDHIKNNPENTLIIYTPAIPKNHKGLNYFKENSNFKVLKRAEALGLITKEKTTIAVAGTHGKTSTSSFITHLLVESGVKCQALLGGITSNYNSNYVANDKNAELFIVEADEYDRSFLQLFPNYAVITSTDPDHLDIYGEASELLKTYQSFCNQVNKTGHISVSESVEIQQPNGLTSFSNYGWGNQDYHIQNLKVINGTYYFDIVSPDYKIQDIKFNVAGDHNVLNCLAAVSIADKFISDKEKLKAAIESYKGVKRRFEYIIKSENLIYVDDYAHHPTEIEKTVSTLKNLYPDKKITGIFQPHLYSRTKDFQTGFAETLNPLDKIILMDIYPAREEPIQGITSEIILEKIENPNKKLVSKENLLNELEKDNNQVYVTIGAGDIDRFVEPIKELLTKRL
jgi:UDP-N-acetylmuramate--alanine ligase